MNRRSEVSALFIEFLSLTQGILNFSIEKMRPEWLRRMMMDEQSIDTVSWNLIL